MKPGPRTQPASILKQKGTYRPDRHKDEPAAKGLPFIENIPTPPDKLSEEGSKEWLRILSSTVRVSNYIALNDLSAFEQHCTNYELLRQAIDELKENGNIIKGKVSPYFKVYNELLKNYNRSCQEFGLTPSSRTKIKIEPIKEHDPWDDFKL